MEAASEAAIVVLPAAARATSRSAPARSGRRVEIGTGGSELHLVVPLPGPEAASGPGERPPRRLSAEAGPGILETTIVLGGAILLAFAIIVFFGGALAEAIGVLVDAAHGGR